MGNNFMEITKDLRGLNENNYDDLIDRLNTIHSILETVFKPNRNYTFNELSIEELLKLTLDPNDYTLEDESSKILMRLFIINNSTRDEFINVMKNIKNGDIIITELENQLVKIEIGPFYDECIFVLFKPESFDIVEAAINYIKSIKTVTIKEDEYEADPYIYFIVDSVPVNDEDNSLNYSNLMITLFNIETEYSIIFGDKVDGIYYDITADMFNKEVLINEL